MPSAFVQQVGLLQRGDSKASRASKAQAILAGTKSKSVNFKLLLFALNSKLKTKSAGFEEVIKMVDDMVVLLGKQQAEDEKQKTWCVEEFEKSADEEAASKTKLAKTDATLAELTDEISTLMEEINSLTAGIAALDKSIAEATDMRKKEHAEYVETMQLNEAATGLVEKAKNRLQKFYNPTLYKAAPKTERTMEQKIIDAGTFVQIKAHDEEDSDDVLSQPYQKSEKSAGVIGLMDMMVREIETDMKDAEYEEK